MQSAMAVVNQGKQVLMLVPEISLTPQIAAKFKARFKNRVAVLHSRLSLGERYDTYRKIARQEVDIVVGARSAIFAPLLNIGLIILDEEHDASYKQESMPRYHTRDLALKRSKTHQATLVFGSASPSIETYARAQKGLYHLIELPVRATGSQLATPIIVDLGDELRKGNYSYFSDVFKRSLMRCIERGEQALVLVNRRGYATYLECTNCHQIAKCPHCDVSLTYHKKDQRLKCHYCGYESNITSRCPTCNGELVFQKAPGIERIAELLESTLDNCKVIRYDFDTTHKKNGHQKLLDAFKNQEGNVLLGTQMIAKGLDFPNVSLVAVLDADQSLNIPDFRAYEKTFQLILQVAGRAGRHQNQSQVIIQTYNPQQYAIVCGANQDYLSFYQQEIEMRKQGLYPPFCHMMSILVYYKIENEAYNVAFQLATYIKNNCADVIVLGPSTSLISKMNDDYRFRILIKYKKQENLFETIQSALSLLKTKVKIDIDVNPYSQL